MAKKRKFCAYRRLERPYTRKSRYRKKSFVRASPVTKIVRFDMGNKDRNDWDYSIVLISKEDLNIRDNALESARQVSNKVFETKIGKDEYQFRIRGFPHHMLRENPLASGAGADRMSTGMKMSFGKVVGLAVRCKKGKKLFEVKTSKQFVDLAILGLHKAAKKLPSTYSVQAVKIEKPKAKVAKVAKPKVLENIKTFVEKAKGENIEIIVDGSVGLRTIPALYNAGATVFVGGTSGLFKDGSFLDNIEEMKNATK